MRALTPSPQNPNPEATQAMLQHFAGLLTPNRLDYEIGPAQFLTVMVGRFSVGELVDRQVLLTMGRSGDIVFTGMFSTLDLGGDHEPQAYTADAQRGSYEVTEPLQQVSIEKVQELGVILGAADYSDAQPLQTFHNRVSTGYYPDPWQLTAVTDKQPLFDA